MRRFAIRTIKDGRVKINNRYYAPPDAHMAYDGRLEGLRYAFGLYAHERGFVCLWGTHALWKAGNSDYEQEYAKGGPHVINGREPWLFWREVDE